MMCKNIIKLISGDRLKEKGITMAALIGTVISKDGEMKTLPGLLSKDEEIRMRIFLLDEHSSHILDLLRESFIHIKLAFGEVKYKRKATIIIETLLINNIVLKELEEYSTEIETKEGIEYHFGVK